MSTKNILELNTGEYALAEQLTGCSIELGYFPPGGFFPATRGHYRVPADK